MTTSSEVNFSPTFGEIDAHLFSRGVHYKLYEALGAHPIVHQGVAGVKFAVWAPNAQSVSLIGDFNFWDGRVSPMRNLGGCGVWELFVPGLAEGEKYKFEIKTRAGELLLKADPFANGSELRPSTASVVYSLDAHEWKDGAWMQKRAEANCASQPMNIYEVHLGSWKKKGGHWLNYKELANELSQYCQEMGFTHVELMPVTEHPLDESWGYQVSGFFAVTSRYGTPQDFQYFVDHLHQQGIGVILDWVPAHFPTDDFSLTKFDGTYLFEHEDPRQGLHPDWNTAIFNYGRVEVSNFLIASALFWLDKMHIDGLRVDAVASMLYLDYGRKEGKWIPNIYGSHENLEAIEFLKHLNSIVHKRFPKALMCAEESTSFLGVTHSLEQGGLGFDLKWNMGWMNDTLRYFHRNPLFRSYHQHDLTFGLIYAFSERFLLVLSHDEVVHGKASFLSKMPGDDWQKFANLRLLYSYMICHPGKNLVFMGAELGMWSEWHCKEELPWELLRYERHLQLQKCIRAINHFYLSQQALWEWDCSPQGFEWIDASDRHNCVLSFLRKGSQSSLVCVHNFTPNFHPHYEMRLKNVISAREVFNTDSLEFGGSGKINTEVKVADGFSIQLAPLATMVFEVYFGH